MAWFFTQDNIEGAEYLITGEDSSHIQKSLRMREGEQVTLISPDGTEHSCSIKELTPEGVLVSVNSRKPCEAEASIEVTLYQCLPKGDKMDFIVQKSVELGVSRIVPVLSMRCVSRPEGKALSKKIQRWQKIALSAAQQSCRGAVPVVDDAMSLKDALVCAKEVERFVMFYEGGGEKLSALIDSSVKSMSVFIGCEGGFDESEVEAAKNAGAVCATLGKRILRAETAPLAALSAIMCLTGNFD